MTAAEGRLTPNALEALIREMYDAFNQSGVQGAMRYFHDEIVWHSDPHFPGGVSTGAGLTRPSTWAA